VYDKFPIIEGLNNTHKIRKTLQELEKQDIRDERFKTWSEIWSKQRIVTEIREIESRGEPIYQHYLLKKYPRLLGAISCKRYFAGWSSAVKAAGFEPQKFTPKRTKFYPTYEEAKRAAKNLGISTLKEYKRVYRTDVNLPASPHQIYENKGWKNWASFLGKSEIIRRKYEECHQVVDGVKQKHCNKCEQWKPETEFHKLHTSKDGLYWYCKKCTIESASKYRGRRSGKKLSK
jgi:hypothetical protein